MPTQKKKVAVFDIDGTLFRSSLIIELVETLLAEEVFPKTARNIFEEEYQLWLDRRGNYQDYIDRVVQVYEENVGGLKLADVMEVADRVLIFHKNRVYRYTRDLIKKYQKTHFLLAISLSPYHIVEPFARYWGFNKVYALFYEVDDQGMFTGSVDHKDLMMRKDKVLKRAVEKENLTLQGSIGVGDTESDATFLELVQRPIAFNPNSTLHEIAKRRGWEIVVERKDVVYNMNEHLKL